MYSSPAMRKKLRSLLLALMASLAVAIVAWLAFTSRRSASLPPLPTPNGYDDFLKAAAMIVPDVGGYASYDHDHLRGWVSSNLQALHLVRLGLSRSCATPTDFNRTNLTDILTQIGQQLASFKILTHLFAAQGRVAELEQRPADAARSYVEAIRFGNEISRGGFVIHRLTGIACNAIGCQRLVSIAPALNREQVRPLITDLEQVDLAWVTLAEVRRNEKIVFRHYGTDQTSNPFRWITGWWYNRAAMKKAAERQDRALTGLRLLTTELALRCYRAEQGAPPAQLTQLVPQYLQRAPQDPFSKQPLVYRTQGTNWLLYSAGPDRKDDGGTAAGRGTAKGDLFFDSPW